MTGERIRLQPLALVLAPLLAGCAGAGDEDDAVLARAFDRSLRWSELRQVIPIGIGEADSAAMADSYIDSWLRQQVELHHAEENLEPARKEFESELRDYRNSLLLYAYEQELVRQRLDTVISSEEIESYYQSHSAEFDLAEDMARARWFAVPAADKKAVKRMQDRFLSGKPEDMREVELALVQRGITIHDRSAQWLTEGELLNEVPLEALPTAGPEGRRAVAQVGEECWFIDIVELRPRHAPAPIELVRHDIRSLLLNRRKTELIGRMRQDLYDHALAAKDAQRY